MHAACANPSKLLCVSNVTDWRAHADASAKFRGHVTTHTIDGVHVNGIFASDLTLQEVQTLSAQHPWPLTGDTRYKQYSVPADAQPEDLKVWQCAAMHALRILVSELCIISAAARNLQDASEHQTACSQYR
jgi:hypothetical protein